MHVLNQIVPSVIHTLGDILSLLSHSVSFSANLLAVVEHVNSLAGNVTREGVAKGSYTHVYSQYESTEYTMQCNVQIKIISPILIQPNMISSSSPPLWIITWSYNQNVLKKRRQNIKFILKSVCA